MDGSAGNEAALAEELSRLRERIDQLERAAQETDTLSRLSARVAAAGSPAALIDALLEESDRLLPWDCCYLARWSPGRRAFRIACYVDTENGRRRAFPGEELAPADAGAALRRSFNGEAVLINRGSGDSVPPLIPVATRRPSASLMFAPARCGDAVSGVLSVQSYTPGRYREKDLRLLQRIADAIAPALERVHAEEALRQAEARHQALIEQIPAVTYTAAIDAAGTRTYVSPQVTAILGYSPAEYASDPELWRRSLHPEDRDRVTDEVVRCQATGHPLACEYRMTARDGRVVWLRDEAAVVRDDAGRPMCLQGVLFNISERKHAEHLLHIQRDLAVALSSVTTLGEAMPLILAFALAIEGLDSGGIYLLDEASGDLHLVVHTGVSDGFVEQVSLVPADSSRARLVAEGRPVYIDGGQLAEREPVVYTEGLRAIAIVPVVSDDRAIGVMNVASRSRPDVPPFARHALEAIAAQIGAAIERVRGREALQQARDELERRVQERTSDLRTANTLLQREMAERRQAEAERERLNAQLREAQKLEAVERFGRGVAHDFNNLMATVLGLASNMRSKRRPDDPDHAKLTQIEEAAETAARLALQLLDFAKGGKIRPHLLSFAAVVRSALTLVPPLLPGAVALESRVRPRLWRVMCDQTQMQQVIVNLCHNAIEAMPGGGRLTLTAENVTLAAPLTEAQPPLAAGQYACLTVEDTGCGMDAETMKCIFDPFFTTKDRGHGLGLAAAYGVMAAHGGAVSVKSTPGEGSAFRLWLPRAMRGAP